ncbi:MULTISPECIES: hypothetical protein [Actinoplanes]|uniref:peptidyl-prolyl cis-trans isomerase n=1 Tax=Actinoplanes TaxID=1865 RepID=UPI0005F2A21F|nr:MULTISPECIES: hypothetical protein [Actinoplanes]GLY06848.1 hypothetical protein Acsp01_72270 [Actinoplanes sp. NBRC 101535]
MKRVAVVAGAAAVLAAITGGVLMLNRPSEVASLDGHPVTRDELVFQMDRLERTTTGTEPLSDRALATIKRDKTLLILAQEQGLIRSVDHADLMADLEDENAERAAAVKAGQVVHGVTAFEPEEYYTHRITELTTALENRLSAAAGDPLGVTDEEVRAAFAADRDAWSQNASVYAYTIMVVPVKDQAAAASLTSRVAAAPTLKQAAAGLAGARLSSATYDGRATTGVNPHDQEVMAVLGTLAPGQISAPVAGTGQLTFYELTGRQVDEQAALTAYASRIRQSLVEEKFERFLQRRVDGGDLRVDTAAVDAINAEDGRA